MLEVSGKVDQVNIKFGTIVVLGEQPGSGFSIFITDSKATISKSGVCIKLEEIKKAMTRLLLTK